MYHLTQTSCTSYAYIPTSCKPNVTMFELLHSSIVTFDLQEVTQMYTHTNTHMYQGCLSKTPLKMEKKEKKDRKSRKRKKSEPMQRYHTSYNPLPHFLPLLLLILIYPYPSFLSSSMICDWLCINQPFVTFFWKWVINTFAKLDVCQTWQCEHFSATMNGSQKK